MYTDYIKVFTTSISDFKCSAFSSLKTSILGEKDYFQHNNFFPIPEAALTPTFIDRFGSKALLEDIRRPRPSLVGIVGHEFFHIFDTTNRQFISQCAALGVTKQNKF